MPYFKLLKQEKKYLSELKKMSPTPVKVKEVPKEEVKNSGD
jgi:hypothetical protein